MLLILVSNSSHIQKNQEEKICFKMQNRISSHWSQLTSLNLHTQFVWPGFGSEGKWGIEIGSLRRCWKLPHAQQSQCHQIQDGPITSQGWANQGWG